MLTPKALALFLEYPTAEILAASDELLAAIDEEAALSVALCEALRRFAEARRNRAPMDAEAEYVALFDTLPGASLYLFQHLYGDSRDRGPALVELIEMYRERGLDMRTRETADYIPLFLEFASQLPDDEARALIGRVAHVFEIMRRRLEAWRSPYAAVFEALVMLSAEAPDEAELARLAAQRVRGPNEFAALDREWEDEPVEFGEKSAHDSSATAACQSGGAGSAVKGGIAPCNL